jgi:hypothetical protein
MSPILDSIGSVKAYGWGALTAGGSFESIATATTTAAQASVVFSSIPSTYTHLQLRWNAQVTAGFSNNNGIGMRFNSDNSSTYAYHTLSGDGTTASAGAVINSTIISRDIVPSTASTNIFGVGIVDILDYQSTSKNKTVRAIAGYDQNGVAVGGGTANGLIYLYSGLWQNTAAITSITITPQYTWGANSTFSLYGIKGA